MVVTCRCNLKNLDVLFTAGLRLVTSNYKFVQMYVHCTRIISAREKAIDLCCLRVKTPHVHHRWWRLHTDLLLLNVKEEKREYRFLFFRMCHFFLLQFALSKLALLPYLECKVLKKKNLPSANQTRDFPDAHHYYYITEATLSND